MQSPFRVDSFWRQAQSNSTLCLLDGTYTGESSMIRPPAGLAGTSGAPITVRALHDGRVLIDGEGRWLPIKLVRNEWFVIEGVNACCSTGTVVGIDRSNHNVIRRVAAWDAADANDFVFGVHHSEHNLLEDVAGWGIARKTFSSSQGGDYTIIRRAWGRWEGSHVVGPKIVFGIVYNNYGMLAENAIGTWSGERMKKSYLLLDDYGKPWVGRGAGIHEDYAVDQPSGIFAVDRLDGDKKANARLLGSIAYLEGGGLYPAPRLVFIGEMESVEVADTLADVDKDAYPRVRTFYLSGARGLLDLSGTATNLSARNITSLGGSGARIGKDWSLENMVEGATTTAAYSSGEGPFQSGHGARLCYRYVDGVLTKQPLWPWPMNQRIIEAMIQSHRQPVDVTATIEKLLGKIPQECREPALPAPASEPPASR